jgi:cell wall-associated NlpC family hydrolase
VQWAYNELGKPYQWGAAGPDSFDCSGLTQYVWGKAGVYLDHYTGSQWNQGQHVEASQLQPGDLVFFGSDLHHVGIYVGNGNMIEAPHTGANVRVSPYNRPDYAGAVRPGT